MSTDLSFIGVTRSLTDNDESSFDSVASDLRTFYSSELAGIENGIEYREVLRVSGESYTCPTLNYKSSGFFGVGLRNLPYSISGPEYVVRSISNGSILFVDNYPFIFSSGMRLTHFGSRYSLLWCDERFRCNRALPSLNNAVDVSGKVVLLSDDCWWPPNYCHWLLDWFTRLAFLSGLLGEREALNVLIPKASVDKWVIESIRIFKLKNPQINFLFVPNNIKVNADEIFVPSSVSSPIPHPANKIASWAVGFIRDNLKVSLSKDASVFCEASTPPKKIYIDRRNSKRGAGVKHDDNFDEFLLDNGIKRVLLEDYSLSDQRIIFENSDLIIGLHGAGFTNLVFSSRGSGVIELFSPDFGSPAYAMLSGRMGLEYSAICGVLDDEDIHKDRAWRTTNISTSSIEEILSRS